MTCSWNNLYTVTTKVNIVEIQMMYEKKSGSNKAKQDKRYS